MWRATIRGLLARRVRLALTAAAVVLGVAFVSATYVLTDTVKAAFDEVFSQTLSRVDLSVHTTLPDEATVAVIVADTLRVLADQWPELKALAADADLHRRVAAVLRGCDGRRVRKAVHGALTLRVDVAEDPARLTAADILASAEQAVAC